MSHLHSIAYKPVGAAPSDTTYVRLPIAEANLLAGHGIDGDTKGGAPNRHLNIMSLEALQSLEGQGFQVAPGQMGEQLILAGLAIDTLPIGTVLQIGETAKVTLTEPRRGCAKFERNQGRTPQQAAGQMGMMAEVVADGPIRVGDSVTVL